MLKRFVIDAEKNASKSIPLEIPENYFVIVSMTTQAAFQITVAITDADNTYFNESRQSTKALPIISKSFYTKSNMAKLVVDVPQSFRLDVRMDTMDIKSDFGELINKTISFVAEDSYDYDYNDLLLTISAWKSEG